MLFHADFSLHTFTPPVLSNKDFPQNGTPKILFLREELVKKVLSVIEKEAKDDNPGSVYLRGPRGSGKTVLLNILGERLSKLYPSCLN